MEAAVVVDALPNPGGLRVEEVTDRAAFIRLRGAWDDLVASTRDELFYRHDFVRTWLDNFAPRASVKVLTVRDASGALGAVLPLVTRRTRMYGIPVRELCAAANAHSCRFDLLARDPAQAASLFLEHLGRDRSWDLLRLTDVPEKGSGFQLLEAAREAGYPVGVWESLRSPYVPLPGSYDALQAGLHSKFRANLRRRRRKLEEQGAVTLERYTGGLELEARLEEGFRLEESGWKGERGTAMAQDGATRGFYRELARTAQDAGWLSLFYLRLNGRSVAFHYGLTYGGRYLLLKPGYDETLKECSPGQLLLEETLKDACGRGMGEFDFLGPDMVWKRDWTEKVRPHSWLYVFRDNALGRSLAKAKFRWVPAAKKRWSAWRSPAETKV